MTYLVIAISLRIILVYKKHSLVDWFQTYAPRWMGSCVFCLAYNFGVLEGIFLGLFLYDTFV